MDPLKSIESFCSVHSLPETTKELLFRIGSEVKSPKNKSPTEERKQKEDIKRRTFDKAPIEGILENDKKMKHLESRQVAEELLLKFTTNFSTSSPTIERKVCQVN